MYFCQLRKILLENNMTVQSEAALEEGLIKSLIQNSYEYIEVKEEKNLRENFKLQLEKHNRKELELHGRTQFTDAEFDRILLHLEGHIRVFTSCKACGRGPQHGNTAQVDSGITLVTQPAGISSHGI